jgi:hypothetical protein
LLAAWAIGAQLAHTATTAADIVKARFIVRTLPSEMFD